MWTYGYSAEEYRAIVAFRNAYGELPAAQIAKLPFYGGLTIVYAVIGAYVALPPIILACADEEQFLGFPLCTEST